MTIYIDNGEKVKTYSVSTNIARTIMTLLESNGGVVCATTHKGYGVKIIDKAESEEK